MRKQLSAMLLSGAVASGAGVFTQAPLPTREIGGVTSLEDIQSATSPPTTLRLGGTIEKYDASLRTLSLTTATGTMQFAVAASVRIRRRNRQIDASELENFSGYRAVVRYSEAHGNKTVESISVFEKPKG